MQTQQLIINVPRFPFHTRQLIPPPGVTEVAGTLLYHGHKCRILDYGTLDAVAFFANSPWRDCVESVSNWWEAKSRRTLWPQALPGDERRLRRCINTERARWHAAIAEEIGRYAQARLIIFHASDRSDWLGVLGVVQALRAQGVTLPCVAFGDWVGCYGSALLNGAQLLDGLCIDDPAASLALLADAPEKPETWEQTPNLLLRRAGAWMATPRKRMPSQVVHAAAAYHEAVYPAFAAGQKLRLPVLCQAQAANLPANALPESLWYRRHPNPVDAEVLAEAMATLALREKCSCFVIGDGGHTPSVDALAQALRRWTLPLQYIRSLSTPDALHCDHKGLWQSGCRGVSMDVPSASQRLLDTYFGADFTISEVEKAMRRLRDVALHRTVQMIGPVPEDDYHSHQELLRFLGRTLPDALHWRLPQVLPGSTWWQQAPHYGFSLSFKRFEQWVNTGDTGVIHRPWEGASYCRMRGWPAQALWKQHQQCIHELESLGLPPEPLSSTESFIARILGGVDAVRPVGTSFQEAIYTLDLQSLQYRVQDFNQKVRNTQVPDSLAAREAAHLARMAAGN